MGQEKLGEQDRLGWARARLDRLNSRLQTTADYVLGLAYMQQGDAAQAERLLTSASRQAQEQGVHV